MIGDWQNEMEGMKHLNVRGKKTVFGTAKMKAQTIKLMFAE